MRTCQGFFCFGTFFCRNVEKARRRVETGTSRASLWRTRGDSTGTGVSLISNASTDILWIIAAGYPSGGIGLPLILIFPAPDTRHAAVPGEKTGRHAARPARHADRPPGSASQERRASCARHTETCLASIESGVFVEDRHVWFLRCARIHEGAPASCPEACAPARGPSDAAGRVQSGQPRTGVDFEPEPEPVPSGVTEDRKSVV